MRIDEVIRSAKDQERWDRYMDYLDRKEREHERRLRLRGKPPGKIDKLTRDPDFRAGQDFTQKVIGTLGRINQWAADDAAKSTMKS